MVLNKDRLAAFYQTAIDRNFHKAADNLCITQSALSQRILKLEQEMETTLLIRKTNDVKLTTAGSVLFDYVRNIENMEQEILNEIIGHRKDINRGAIRVASYSSILRSVIVPTLSSLIKKSPKVQVEFFSRELRELPAMLKSGEVDFIILDYFMQEINLKALKIGEEQIVHVRNKSSENDEEVFLDHDAEDMTSYNFFRSQGMENINLRRHFYDDIYGIVEGVKLGLGQAIVSKHLISSLSEIKVIPHERKVSNPLVLYYHENRYLTPLHKAIIQALHKTTSDFL